MKKRFFELYSKASQNNGLFIVLCFSYIVYIFLLSVINKTVAQVVNFASLALCFLLIAAVGMDLKRFFKTPDAKILVCSALLALSLTGLLVRLAEVYLNISLPFYIKAAVCILLFIAAVLFWTAVKSFVQILLETETRFPAEKDSGVFWIVFFFSVNSLFLLWSIYYPSGVSTDTWNQLAQIRGDIPYSDIHAIAHTIFLKLLFRIGENFSAVIFVQICGVGFINAFFAQWLNGRGLPLIWILPPLAFNLAGCSRFILCYVYPWKDAPYTFCLCYICYMTIRLINQPGKKPGVLKAALLGVALAFASLFRYNGIIASVFCGGWLFVYFLKNKAWKPFAATLFAAAISVAAVSLYSGKVLHTQSPENGFSVQVFGSGIAAVVAGEGNISPELLSRIEEIFSIDYIKENYKPWETKRLIWTDETGIAGEFKDRPDLQVFNNRFVLAMGERRQELVRLYLELLPRNPGLMARDVIYNTYAVWGTEFYQDYFYSNSLAVLAILFLALEFWGKAMIKRHWAVFAPVACNMISVAISTITNETRYLLPTFALFPFLLMYVLWAAGRSSGYFQD
ncbi:MAG: hypothetical protein LBC56_03600 [Oscillospiraceae bacterium]|jgi:hypothetical protein|nr:hypothetical protein [Oscillospiraceae bacterium]